MTALRDAASFAGAVLAAPVSRWQVRARGDEKRRRLPGDDMLPEAREQWTNAITIRGRPAQIWPWLAQMGCNRGGWYSYDGLDNGGSPSAQQIVAGLQRVAVGDAFPWTPSDSSGFIVKALDRGHALVLGGEPPPYSVTWALVLDPVGDTTTRLITRCRGTPRSPLYALLTRFVAHPIHYAMQRKQLLNIKRRVEAISELSATRAPSKDFLTAMMPVFSLLVIGFGAGVWRRLGWDSWSESTTGRGCSGQPFSPSRSCDANWKPRDEPHTDVGTRHSSTPPPSSERGAGSGRRLKGERPGERDRRTRFSARRSRGPGPSFL